MIEESVRKKFEALISKASQIVSADIMERDEQFIASCVGWAVGALNAVELAVPFESNPYRRRITALAAVQSFDIERIREMATILRALLEDIDAGLIANFGNAIRAETFDEFLDHAEAYRQKGKNRRPPVC